MAAVLLLAGCSDDLAGATPATEEPGGVTVPDDPAGMLDWIEARIGRSGTVAGSEPVSVTLVWGAPAEESRVETAAFASCDASWSDSSLGIGAVDRTARGPELAGVWIEITRLPIGMEPGRSETGPPSPVGQALVFLVTGDGRTAVADVGVTVSEADRSGAFEGPDALRPERSFAGTFRCG